MAKTKAPENAFPRIAGLLHPDTKAVVLGSISRTWYQDQARLVELLMLLDEYGVQPVLIGDIPFRLAGAAAEKVCQGEGRFLMVVDPEDTEALVSAEFAEVCFAFPSRVSENILATSPLMELVLERQIPTVAIYPDGRSTYLTTEG